MKLKSIICLAMTLMVISIFAYLKFNSKTNQFSSLQLENIEALVDGESDGEHPCYNSIKAKEGCNVRYCPLCEYVPGTTTQSKPSYCPNI